MMCFLCVGEPSLRIELVEEILRFSAYREDGVRIGANLVLTLPERQDPDLYLNLIHRRTLDKCRLASFDDWDKEKVDGEFPYSYIFRNVLKNRVVEDRRGTLSIRIAPGEDTTVEGVRVIAPENGSDFHLEELFRDLSEKDRDNAPFTCLRIGPFPKAGGSYLMRLECHIGEPSFGDLIPEDLETGTRIYKVYGPDHIRNHIESYDLPQCSVRSDSSVCQRYREFFQGIRPENMLIPARYQIIAVDNPNGNPRQLQAMDLTNDLQDITGEIPPQIYDHAILEKIPGRLHWFASKAPGNGFFLQLSGPMALAELCALRM